MGDGRTPISARWPTSVIKTGRWEMLLARVVEGGVVRMIIFILRVVTGGPVR